MELSNLAKKISKRYRVAFQHDENVTHEKIHSCMKKLDVTFYAIGDYIQYENDIAYTILYFEFRNRENFTLEKFREIFEDGTLERATGTTLENLEYMKRDNPIRKVEYFEEFGFLAYLESLPFDVIYCYDKSNVVAKMSACFKYGLKNTLIINDYHIFTLLNYKNEEIVILDEFYEPILINELIDWLQSFKGSAKRVFIISDNPFEKQYSNTYDFEIWSNLVDKVRIYEALDYEEATVNDYLKNINFSF